MKFLNHESAVGNTNFLFRNHGPEGLAGGSPDKVHEAIRTNLEVRDAFEAFAKTQGYTDDRTRSLVMNEIVSGGDINPAYKSLMAQFEATQGRGDLGTHLSQNIPGVTPFDGGRPVNVELFDTPVANDAQQWIPVDQFVAQQSAAQGGQGGQLGSFDKPEIDVHMRTADAAVRHDQVGSTGSEYNVTNKQGTEAADRIMGQQQKLELFNKEVESLFGRGMDSAARELAKSKLNTTGKSATEVLAKLRGYSVSPDQLNSESLINFGLTFDAITNKMVARPNVDQANDMINFLSGSAEQSLEKNVNLYAVSELNEMKDSEVREFFLKEYEVNVDKLDDHLFKDHFFKLGLIRNNKGGLKVIRAEMQTALNKDVSAAERSAAANRVMDALQTKFEDRVKKKEEKDINQFERDMNRKGITYNGKKYELRHDYSSVKIDGKALHNKYSQKVRQETWQIREKGSDNWVPAPAGFIQAVDRQMDANDKYSKNVDKLRGVEAGMQEAQRDLIISNIAALRLQGVTFTEMRSGGTYQKLETKVKQQWVAGGSERVFDADLIRQVVDQMASEQQQSTEAYLANAKANYTSKNLEGVDKGNAGSLYHGPDITNFSPEQLNAVNWEYLKRVTPHQNPKANGESSAYKILESLALHGFQFTDKEMSDAFGEIDVNTAAQFGVDHESAINTSADRNAANDAETLRGPNDKLAKLQTITRKEPVTLNGRTFDVEVTYDIYLRAGCMNPIVRTGIKSSKVIEQMAGYYKDVTEQVSVTHQNPDEMVAQYIKLPSGVAGSEMQLNAVGIAIKAVTAYLLLGNCNSCDAVVDIIDGPGTAPIGL